MTDNWSDLEQYALPADTPGAWIRAAINKQRAGRCPRGYDDPCTPSECRCLA